MELSISVVVPVYNSATSLPELVGRTFQSLKDVLDDFEMVLVDDKSTDDSWNVLKSLKMDYGHRLKIYRLRSNSGQHNAILAGFEKSTGDIVITMDDDLQNPPEEIIKLANAIESGYELAIGSYHQKMHTRLKNISGNLVDRTLRMIFNLPNGFQLTSFRAISRCVVDDLNKMTAGFPYVTAMLLSQTSNHINVSVRHDERKYGSSNYTTIKSIRLVANLLLNYSTIPVLGVGLLCFIALIFSLGTGSWAVLKVLTTGVSVPGWASIVVVISTFNSMMLLCMFVFALYISRMNRLITGTKQKYKFSSDQ